MKTGITTILKTTGRYKIDGMLWIAFEGERSFGPGRMQLLEHIARTGSINKAAQAMGMSYKKASAMVAALNGQFTQPVVLTQSGGKGGGGAVLTDAAKQLMNYHTKLRKRFALLLERETSRLYP